MQNRSLFFHLYVFSFKVNYTLCDTCCVSTIHIHMVNLYNMDLQNQWEK